jgi:hypothetical protein
VFGYCCNLLLPHHVIAGLDPAIHGAAALMDARLKAGHDFLERCALLVAL